ncbi:MAG: histidine phosphatase family protein [Spirochaetes bacterium]|nr:histidine phosphatase family protein [Spirochaetota bacterium]
MINFQLPAELKNRYFAFRHGESEANTEGIIISNPETGIYEYGLSSNGRKQVQNSIENSILPDSDTKIYSSDFKRAVETAEIIKSILNVSEINISHLLRERFFGEFEKTSNKNYDKVWSEDRKNPDHNLWKVESVNSVLSRTSELIITLESRFSNMNIILVSHGDALQILQTFFLQTEAARHRDVEHLETAELRLLNRQKASV